MDNEIRINRLPDDDVIDVRQWRIPSSGKPYPTKYGIRADVLHWQAILGELFEVCADEKKTERA